METVHGAGQNRRTLSREKTVCLHILTKIKRLFIDICVLNRWRLTSPDYATYIRNLLGAKFYMSPLYKMYVDKI